MLINAVKDVASALGDLIQSTKFAAGKNAKDPSMESLKESAKVKFIFCFLQFHLEACLVLSRGLPFLVWLGMVVRVTCIFAYFLIFIVALTFKQSCLASARQKGFPGLRIS